ncbi:ER membrane protein complex subunit 4 [Perkinsus olseni]|uniref:ER membrane protein complex subunit 4 n=1 Tax=Perkinsus olseni TaxID=32597 RepID=A0A7J6UG48_PEROL|nr:ER membrane protein complex subunit 4 [Perkinsus olseni]KAF4756240.1 ER membrane protein complex subunit 4 [Perkinsus olseni]
MSATLAGELFEKWDLTFPEKTAKKDALPDPTGFKWKLQQSGEAAGQQAIQKLAQQKAILEKRAWETAISPAKSIFMNLFMLWMSGSGPGLFSILIVGYATMNTVKSLAKCNQVFEQFAAANVLLQKLAYIGINVAILAYLGNHAANMGILPIASGDWIQFIPEQRVVESARPLDARLFVDDVSGGY